MAAPENPNRGFEFDHSSPHLDALAQALSIFHRTETNDLPAILLLACSVEGFLNLVGEAAYGKLWEDELERLTPCGKIRLLLDDSVDWSGGIWADVRKVVQIRNDLAHPKPKTKADAKTRRKEQAHDDAPRLVASVIEALRQLSARHSTTKRWPAIHKQLAQANAKNSKRE